MARERRIMARPPPRRARLADGGTSAMQPRRDAQAKKPSKRPPEGPAAHLWGALVPGIRWEVGAILPVDLDFGVDLNAFYDREGLKFFHGSAAGRTVFSGESPDIVCHELGHALLDSFKPQLFDAASIEVAAFHESFGDMSAILSALQLPSVREGVLAETGGVLRRASRLSRFAEQIGWGLRQSVLSAV